MKLPVIDSHIHFDMYTKNEQKQILQDMEKEKIEALLTVSRNITSSVDNLALAQENKHVFPAFGFHPEQPLPANDEMNELFHFLDQYEDEMIAVGEVGLPFYRRKEYPDIPLEPYTDILEKFMIKAKLFNKPIILHAVYEDAPIVCDLLEKHSIQKAHFHWFKGDSNTIKRMIENNYFISVTPDILYKEKTKRLVKMYPLSQMMAETDGPWSFEGPFQNKQTHPKMIHLTIQTIAEIKKMDIQEVYETIFKNTVEFYQLK